SGKNIHRFPDAKESDEWGVSPDKGFELKLNDTETHDLVFNRRERDIVAPKAPKMVVAPAVDPGAAGTEPSKPVEPAPPVTTPVKAVPVEVKTELKEHKFVDRQLQKSLDYLTQEVARAQ